MYIRITNHIIVQAKKRTIFSKRIKKNTASKLCLKCISNQRTFGSHLARIKQFESAAQSTKFWLNIERSIMLTCFEINPSRDSRVDSTRIFPPIVEISTPPAQSADK
jgi:hypothetical protein